MGYALKEPWGQPRAVIGFSADEAERLAEFLERGSGERAAHDLGAADRALAGTSQLSGSQHRHSFLPGSGARLKMSGLGRARPRPESRLLSFLALAGALPDGDDGDGAVLHRDAAIGIVLRHSGQSRVVTSACLANRAVIFAIGATIRK